MGFEPGKDNASQNPYKIFTIYSPSIRPTPRVDNGIIQNSWDELSKISFSRNYSGLSLGDKKEIVLSKGKVGTNGLHSIDIQSGGFYCYAEIIDFDHNADKEGYGITFQISVQDNLIGFGPTTSPEWETSASPTTGGFYMNTSSTNAGGWAGSAIRTSVIGSSKNSGDATTEAVLNPVQNTLMERFPKDVRLVMKPIRKWTNNKGGNYNEATYCYDYLPLLSPYEIADLQTSDQKPCDAEYENQEKYTYLIVNGRPKGVKYYADTSKPVRQRLRSPILYSPTHFTGVNADATSISSIGSYVGSYYGIPNCISPIFLI